MDMRDLFAQNPWWDKKEKVEEEYEIVKWKNNKYRWVPDIVEKIGLDHFSFHTILGPRQTGKTTALKLLVIKLLKERDQKSIFYFNCENIADYKELSELLNLYLEFKEENKIKNSVIMLDEITMPKEWYRAIKFNIDRGKFQNDVIVITGSSSISVKREVELFPGRRGKGKDFVLYPLSFREFIGIVNPELKNKIMPAKKLTDIKNRSRNALIYESELNKYLQRYMEFGGFPLSIANPGINKEEIKEVYLAWIKNAVLKADRNDIIARQIIKIIIETSQTDISWEGVSKKIEIKSPKTVFAYVNLLKSIFALNVLYNIDVNGKKIRFGKNKKIYVRDPLLLEIFEDWALTNVNDKKSALAEALLIEHLERFFPERVYFWKNGFEIDAIVLENGKLYGFESKWREKSHAKGLSQLKDFIIITKKEYSKKPAKIPLAVFLSILEV